MTNPQTVLDRAVAQNDVPFVVAMAANADGVTFSGAAGDASDGKAANEETLFRIFSMTKAVGSLGAMILIDRGKLGIDTPIGDIIPAWDDLQVLDGFDADGKPVLRAAKTRGTIRHLATHTSGLEYEIWNTEMPKFLEATGHPTTLTGLKASLGYPLMFDPGTRWGYGVGTDWLGQVIEAVDGRPVEQFTKEEILDPLGMTSTVFEPDGMTDRLATLSIRGEDGNFSSMEFGPPAKPEFYGMGHALYSTAPDYLRFLRMILNDGALEGTRILSPDAMKLMREDQMQGLCFETMHTVAPHLSASVDPFPGMRHTHSFAFVRNEEDIPGRRKAGSLSWAGVLNTHYWADPASDVAGVIMTQSLPFVEEPFLKTYAAFEEAVYASK
ncbi:serine hydrolase [Thalassococcus sp. S3]|uniref:serine hydrolase domain-containing protein n=1 Tax=Thalassococcus sp. S3 TaxID=2017482 RepID=UPI0013EE5BC4|nr:serine hydrolase domain-containing protein [Thalassococcus sp. S3]